jgi:hypothetical protein
VACPEHNNSLESPKRSLVKAAAEIPLETERAVTAEWPENLKPCFEVTSSLALRYRVAILSDIIINENLETIAIKLFGLKIGCFV